MAAFLWRSAGSPAFAGANEFGDVPAGSYYEVAVGWLADQGVTSGTGQLECSHRSAKVTQRADGSVLVAFSRVTGLRWRQSRVR
jgi:hypothetical protein